MKKFFKSFDWSNFVFSLAVVSFIIFWPLKILYFLEIPAFYRYPLMAVIFLSFFFFFSNYYYSLMDTFLFQWLLYFFICCHEFLLTYPMLTIPLGYGWGFLLERDVVFWYLAALFPFIFVYKFYYLFLDPQIEELGLPLAQVEDFNWGFMLNCMSITIRTKTGKEVQISDRIFRSHKNFPSLASRTFVMEGVVAQIAKNAKDAKYSSVARLVGFVLVGGAYSGYHVYTKEREYNLLEKSSDLLKEKTHAEINLLKEKTHAEIKNIDMGTDIKKVGLERAQWEFLELKANALKANTVSEKPKNFFSKALSFFSETS